MTYSELNNLRGNKMDMWLCGMTGASTGLNSAEPTLINHIKSHCTIRWAYFYATAQVTAKNKACTHLASYSNSDFLRPMAIQTPSDSLMGLKADAGLEKVRHSEHCPCSSLYEHCMVTSLPSSDEAPWPFWSHNWIHLQVGHWYGTGSPHGWVQEWDHFRRHSLTSEPCVQKCMMSVWYERADVFRRSSMALSKVQLSMMMRWKKLIKNVNA